MGRAGPDRSRRTVAARRASRGLTATAAVAHESFNYALLDEAETRLLGCVYLDPPDHSDHDVVVSWWVVDDCVGTPVEAELDRFVPECLTTAWPFRRPHFYP